jgi:periplasmic protein TonB
MKTMVVIEEDRWAQLVKGWGLSIALHGCLLLAVMTAMPKLTLTQQSQPFHWTVALVETPSPATAVSSPTPPTPASAPTNPVQAKAQPPRPPEPSPQLAPRLVQRQDVPQPIHRESEPVQREVQMAQREPQPIQRDIEPVHRDAEAVQRELHPKVEAEPPVQQLEAVREAVAMQNTRPDPQEIQRAERVVDTPVNTESARETSPAVEQQPTQTAMPQETSEAPAPVMQQQRVETRPETEVVARAPAMESQPAVPLEENPAPIQNPAVSALHEPTPVSPTPAVPETSDAPPVPPVTAATSDPPAPAVQEQAPVVARSLTPSPARKADYGWLAESLHRRIIEVRQYPNAARLNGWEGKVVLRVQIRQDGHLDSVSVVKSSGHETLDNAAMEAVKRACPLHMKHELASPMVVVQVPINYSLNR